VPTRIEDPPGGIAEDLVGTEWVLASLHSYPLPDGTYITLNMNKDGIGGSSDCNSYRGKATMEEGNVKACDIQSAAKGCKEDVGQREEAYLRALSSSASYQVQDGRLEMQDTAGETTLIYTMKGRDEQG
jgi:heat shock protein HslJ